MIPEGFPCKEGIPINTKEFDFTITPQYERYYSEDTSFGVYSFLTKDDIPYCKDHFDPFSESGIIAKEGTLAGNMQKLLIGTEYKVTGTLVYNEKYKSYQYTPKVISAIVPKTSEKQKEFLQSIITEKQAETLISVYPNIVEDVVQEKADVDLSKLKGIGEITWKKIREKILANYVISDILTLLQPIGVTYRMIQKLLDEESNPSLLKEKLLDNPYIMTKINGLGFKTVDRMALKLNPEIRCSNKRTSAFLYYFFQQTGETSGDTWVPIPELEKAVRDNIPDCFDIYKKILEEQEQLREESRFLYVSKGRVGLKYYFLTERTVYHTLLSLSKEARTWEIDIESGILKSEKEQGFQFSEEQKKIIQKSCESNVVLISGCAGTGKTSISRALLHIYQNYSISCCALSAKAAQRITEATGFPASTIHRLLQYKGTEFVYNEQNPLPCDVLLVDECSMINSSLFSSLLTAVRPGSKVILCGDNQQLPPIGYGNIFSDLLEKKKEFQVNCLTKVHRQAERSGILMDANKIRKGIFPISNPEPKIITGELQDMTYIFRDSRESLFKIAVNTFLKSVKESGIENSVIITPRKKDCINSTKELNKAIQKELIPDGTPEMSFGDMVFRQGAKVIQRVNNYEKNVFNGEVGFITRIWQESDAENEKPVQKFEVCYQLNDSEKIIQYNIAEIVQIDLAYALTVHLSQGSGYQNVIILIDNTHYSLLDSCLLYTAITRAKERCLLLAEPSAFKKCLLANKSKSRQTWLPFFKLR